MVKRLFENSDKIGALSSLLCLVHCLALPLFIGFIPVLQAAEVVEFIFLGISCVAVFLSIYNARNRFSMEVLLMVLALGTLLLSVYFEESSIIFQSISILAASTLAFAHYLSYRKHKTVKS